MVKAIRMFTFIAAFAMAAFTPGQNFAQETIPALAQGATATQEDEQGDQQEGNLEDEQSPAGRVQAASVKEGGGAVFAMTNATAGNRIVRYSRASDGTLTRVGSIRTRGLGQGVDTDTQGPLRLSADRRYLYAVNPGSDEITVFAVNGTRLRFVQKVYAGDQPLSLTLSGNLLYVLNGSVAGNGIRGFTVASDGRLTPLADSFRALSSPIAVPGVVQFSPDGKVILITHKTTNLLTTPQNVIDAFTVGADGFASAAPIANASFGLRPFSLAFRNDGKLVVVESFNASPNLSAVSSYQGFPDGRISVISGSVPNQQTDVCWVVVTNDQRYAFTANFGSGTISSYSLAPSGALTLINGKAAFLGDMSQPVDLSLSADGRFLYLLLRGTGGVAAFRIGDNASLTPLGVVVGGLPVADGASGLAAY